jgi:hypothetical protein
MVEVRFQYDEDLRKWAVLVTGVDNPTVAQQAFAAVVLTCWPVNPNLQVHAPVKETPEGYHVIPAM